MIRIWQVIMLFLILIVISGCQVSEEESLELGKQKFATTIEQEKLNPNIDLEMLDVHLPRGFEVIEETEYNVKIQEKDQLYLLFHQPAEPPFSTFHLERDLELKDQALVFESFESDEQTAYLIISEEEDNQLFVVVTVGGVRISTLTTYRALEDNIGAMTEIVRSYQGK